ncbi:MAG TPA: diguanylate cyclase [bacterium]|nr:diguanylate cyclase [bacterium]
MSHDPLSQFLHQEESALRALWEKSLTQLAAQLEGTREKRAVFAEMRGLLWDLVAVVERSGSPEQAVDAQFKEILVHLKRLQEEHDLASTEIVIQLFLMRDVIRESVKTPGTSGQDFSQKVDQVSMLLNRLGLVFFEGAMRLREEGDGQDVLAIEYALLYERARQMAITDRLTGLYNFGYFLERLKEERLRADRYHRLLSLVLFDIDHFKKYNDTSGHPAGNEVLKRIATILKQEAREVDIVARYGGEELVVVLPETARKRAHDFAERVRQRVEETLFDHMRHQPMGKLTLSAGVATFPVDAGTEDDLIKKADQSLYQAKNHGRNRVVSFDPPIKIPIHFWPYRGVQKVALVGNFNNWDKDADLMVKQGDGSYLFTISLNPGLYHYKFVLDDAEWIADPSNPERIHDGVGGDNSILRVNG